MRGDVLSWYDRHGRDLPWRVRLGREGRLQAPYRVWLSEVMLQQTTVQAVIPYYLKFMETWPDIRDLAKADDDDVMQAWAGLGYYSRARNLLSCARQIVDDYDGIFPQTPQELKKLAGIGDYTAAAIASIAYNTPSVVIDGNIERIGARVLDNHTPLPALKAVLRDQLMPVMTLQDNRQSDFVQALMDIGATICTPKSPKCMICPIRNHCTSKTAEALPVKAPKKVKPHRIGRAYIIKNAQGDIAIEKRPDHVMLGNMWGLPSSNWHDKKAPDAIAFDASGSVDTGHKVRHVFTHFSLDLHLYDMRMAEGNPEWRFVSWGALQAMGLPSLYQKAVQMIGKG